MTSQTLPNQTSTGLHSQLLSVRKGESKGYTGLEHRLETVADVNGIEYINDSKATDFTTTWFSLECMAKPVIWIVGVASEDADYTVFREIVDKKVKAIVCFGTKKDHTASLLSVHTKFYSHVTSVKEAVQAASAFASEGDVVLFSPACAGYVMFPNYKERGERFREAVRQSVIPMNTGQIGNQ